jgi:integrase
MPAAARKVALTDRSLQALRPAAGGQRATVWDALLPGMAVRVSAKGKRSFYAVKRQAGQAQPSWVMLGHYPVMSLAEARAKAREALSALMEGQDPAALAAAKRRAREEAEAARKENTFAAVAEEFITRHASKLRGGHMTEGIIRRELIPAWGEQPIAAITRRDVLKLVEAILDRGGARPPAGTRRASGGPFAARHALSAARTLFNWAIERDVITASPCDRIKAKKLLVDVSLERDRVLGDDELRAVWNAATQTDYPYGPLVRLLLLTGQRRDEIAGAAWDEIDLDRATLTIGAERMKAKAGHAVPLTPAAVEILRGLPRFAGDFVFSGQTGGKPFSGFSKAKVRLDQMAGIAPHTLHDLRRTVRTRLAELGVTPFVGELVIGHTQKGVHAVYDLHRYTDEKRDALERWERRLMAIVAPEPEPEGADEPELAESEPASNVVPIRAA